MRFLNALFSICWLLLLAATPVFSQQTNRVKTVIDLAAENSFSKNTRSTGQAVFLKKTKKAGFIESQSIILPFSKPEPFTAFSVVMEAVNSGSDGLQILLSRSSDGQNWSIWQPLKMDEHAERADLRQVSELLFLEPEVQQIRLRVAFAKGSKARLKRLELHFFNPGGGEKGASKPDWQPVQGIPENGSCPCPQPAFLTRSQWCTSGSCPSGTVSSTTVTHLIVHHEAGQNSSSNWLATVTAIWDFHVNTNGWSDIAYNWLIAPDGTVFQGRSDNIIGAHFCGKNGGTMGICMLGNFETAQPSTAALQKLKDLLAWKSCSAGLNPTGSAFHSNSGLTLKTISGHQDGCSTACPGANLYPLLSGIRTEVASIIANCGTPTVVAPVNDKCFNATVLYSYFNCNPTSGTVTGATASSSNVEPINGGQSSKCDNFTGTPHLHDVWYKFNATQSTHTITVDPNGSGTTALDPVVAIYKGACSDNLVALACLDQSGGGGGTTALTWSGFTPPDEYLIRLYDWGNNEPANGDFQICITHPDCSVTNGGQTSASYDACPQTGSFPLITGAGCLYSLTSTKSWLIPGTTGGTGSTSISYTVLGNTDGNSRQGSITTIPGGATLLTVFQAGCIWTLSPNLQNVGYQAGSGSFQITTCPSCQWSVSTNCSWLTANPTSGQGSQAISFQYQGNGTLDQRTCSITAGNQTFNVTQAGNVVATQSPDWAVASALFPNPTDGPCQLTGNSAKAMNVKWVLADALGRQILSHEAWLVSGDFSLPFDFSGVSAGHYLLVLTDEEGFRRAVRVAVK